MRIQDAKPGDVLADADGALWLVGKTKARCILDDREQDGDRMTYGADPLTIATAEKFGPFTRLVPEKEQE